MSRTFQKPPTSAWQQIELLRQRGLYIPDEARAERYLNAIGYYRLSAYFIPFEQVDMGTPRQHLFKNETEFEQIIDLYIFDRKFRLLVMEAIERIEIFVRAQWASTFALHYDDAHAYMHSEYFKYPWKHCKALVKLAAEVKESRELANEHYRNTYKEPFLELKPDTHVVDLFSLLFRWVSGFLFKSGIYFRTVPKRFFLRLSPKST